METHLIRLHTLRPPFQNNEFKRITIGQALLFNILFCNILHTYIYNSSANIINLVSHTTYVVCVNFIHFYTVLKSTPNDTCFKKLFMAILLTLRVFTRNLLKENRRRNTFCILF